MNGKTVVITGGTSGIGEQAAKSLARMGARILFVARNEARGAATLSRLRAAGPGAHQFFRADLSNISQTKAVAQQIAAAAPKIDVLINNAGAMFSHRIETADGLEKTFALNHLSYFIMSLGLLENLKAAGNARIISTASRAHSGQRLDFSDLQLVRDFSGYPAYGRSKLCNILFTRELARRIKDTGVIANCLHPGFVATRFAESATGFLGFSFFLAKKIAAISPEHGAQTLVYLASSPEAGKMSGQYFHHCMPVFPSSEARNDEVALKLWNVSANLTGLSLPDPAAGQGPSQKNNL